MTHWTAPEWEPSPETAALTDAELITAAIDTIKSVADDVAAITGAKPATVLHGLAGYRWPLKGLDAASLADILEDATLLLHGVQYGMSLQAAAGAVALARGVKVRAEAAPRNGSRRNGRP
ncbi:MAG TPA: hypothetical protein VME67_03700 [Mycobacterium sp.]|nr:hypothetical protein [Mycobacterium sp.]HTX94007.1 hypothetical protein [Mycobacterium sp.]